MYNAESLAKVYFAESSTRVFNALLDASPDFMLMCDMQGAILDLNLVAAQASGLTRDELLGKHINQFFVDQCQIQKLLDRLSQHSVVTDINLAVYNINGTRQEIRCTCAVSYDAVHGIPSLLFIGRDLAEIKRYQSLLIQKTYYDPLTTLPNRTFFLEKLLTSVEQCTYKGQFLVVMFIALDNFKLINEALGGLAGDEVLKQIANRLEATLAQKHTLASLGGGKFALLLENLPRINDADNIACHLLDAVLKPLMIGANELMASCSIGITTYPFDKQDANGLMRNAEIAMRQARQKCNSYHYFSADLDANAQRRLEMESLLWRSVKDGCKEFSLVYQPQVDLATGRICGVESLLRWTSAEMGFISPAEFIPLAERSGSIVQLGEWVIYEACQQAKRWQDELGLHIPVAINLSARQFYDANISDYIAYVLAKTGLKPEFLEVELTESVLMHDVEHVLHVLTDLKKTGVRVAVDDFGTGYSSLSYLKEFPLDTLKVDRSFISTVPSNSKDMAIVQAIIAIGHNLELKVIAEGAETQQQLDFLISQGCDEVQGFYLSKPLPAADLALLLTYQPYFRV